MQHMQRIALKDQNSISG